MNYTTLKTNIQNFLEDDSTELNASIDQIIAQAEDMIFQRLPNLPCFRKNASVTLVQGQTDYIVPSARMIRQVSVITANVTSYLNHRVDSYLRDYWPNATTQGVPEMYSTKTAATGGTTFTVAPTPDDTTSTYQVDYISPETGLSSSTANKTQFDEAVGLFVQEMQRDYAAEYNGGI